MTHFLDMYLISQHTTVIAGIMYVMWFTEHKVATIHHNLYYNNSILPLLGPWIKRAFGKSIFFFLDYVNVTWMWSYDNTLDSLNMPLHIMFSGFTFGICSPFQFFLRYSTHFYLCSEYYEIPDIMHLWEAMPCSRNLETLGKASYLSLCKLNNKDLCSIIFLISVVAYNK